MASMEKKVSNHIPNDIAFDILSKLPVKSLKRFSCVRKSWANLFENPQFMSMYRNNFLSKDDDHNSRLLLKHRMPPYTHDPNDRLYLLSGETFENSVKLDWPPPFEEDHHDIFIMGSGVNGILCLYQGDGLGHAHWIGLKVVLWNPSTKEFKVIPPGFVDCPLDVGTCFHVHGFGYDPVTDDYKLIQYFCFFDGYAKPVPYESLWKIYSLKSNCWRELHVEMPNHSWALRALGSQKIDFAIYLNGVCHWWGYEHFHGEEVLVSFNLSDEVFIKTPVNRRHGDLCDIHLVVLKGSIAMISMCADNSFYDISILGELGVTESWTKLFRIGPLPGVEVPIGVGNKGDIFFIKNTNEELARFDLNTKMIDEIGVQGKYRRCQIVIYNESLLPFGGINS